MSGSTRNGDLGFTNLLGGERVRKDHPIIELVGEIDELSAWIGITRSETEEFSINVDDLLDQLQTQLSTIMSFISSARSGKPFSLPEPPPSYLSIIEDWISTIEEQIKVPKVFQKAGRTKLGSYFNLMRVISRRVERKAVVIFTEDANETNQILPYFNRLSTLFYVLWLLADQKLN